MCAPGSLLLQDGVLPQADQSNVSTLVQSGPTTDLNQSNTGL